jgi:hypothetical protein
VRGNVSDQRARGVRKTRELGKGRNESIETKKNENESQILGKRSDPNQQEIYWMLFRVIEQGL